MHGNYKKLLMACALGALDATEDRVELGDYCDDWAGFYLVYTKRGETIYDGIHLYRHGTYGIEQHTYNVVSTNVGHNLEHIIAILMMGIDITASEIRHRTTEQE